ncbi:MAG: hypothetical protein KatS3mg078_0868 [Deltaproteobacteria bacterium]|jgi:hypothetical protein|nr:MAG: hypothetical protein KatS3mg078_0868 [Deltaproteobacteria bacterium]
MGLIDDIRKKRDSWMKRFEEHRRDESEEKGYTDREEEIQRNRQLVGVFPSKDKLLSRDG